MNKADKELAKLIEYIDYLLSDKYKVYYRLNKNHIKKIKKIVKEFSREYTKIYWGWK